MSEEEQTERKEIGRIKLSDNQDLIASVVESKKFRFIIEDKADNKKLELGIVDKNMKDKEEDPLYKSIRKRSNFKRSVVVYIIVEIILIVIIYLAASKWRASFWWCLLPVVILGVGLLVQGLDAYLPWGLPEHVEEVYKKLKKKL